MGTCQEVTQYAAWVCTRFPIERRLDVVLTNVTTSNFFFNPVVDSSSVLAALIHKQSGHHVLFVHVCLSYIVIFSWGLRAFRQAGLVDTSSQFFKMLRTRSIDNTYIYQFVFHCGFHFLIYHGCGGQVGCGSINLQNWPPNIKIRYLGGVFLGCVSHRLFIYILKCSENPLFTVWVAKGITTMGKLGTLF